MPDDHPMPVISTKAFNERTGLVVGFPMTHAERHADNPFAIPAPGAKGEPGYLLTHQPKSFDWRERNALPHPWSAGHTKLLAAALKRFDAVFSMQPLNREEQWSAQSATVCTPLSFGVRATTWLSLATNERRKTMTTTTLDDLI